MLVINRFRVPEDQGSSFREAAEELRSLMAGCPGHVAGSLGRNVDDPELWALSTTWADVGSYRRAISTHRAAAMTVMARAVDEPSAYELVEPGGPLNTAVPRGG